MKNIYITWHYTTHGVAYLKHILSRFYEFETLPDKITVTGLEQVVLHNVFDNPNEKGFLFDEIVYLIAPQQAFDNLSSRRFSYKKTILEDELIRESGLIETYEKIIADDNVCYHLEKEIQFVKDNYPNKIQFFEQSIWRNIQHFDILEQIKWLTEYSNFKNVYNKKLKVIELNVTDLRDEKMIAEKVSTWAKEYFKKQSNSENIINLSLGSNETQVVWHILAEAGQLPEKTRFIKTYDDKSDKPEKRFKQFSIQETSTNLISTIGADFKIYSETKSPSRELVNKKIETFLKSGFSILLIGERGIGKSKIASEAKERLRKLDKTIQGDIIEANCASFANDTMAESELFGYKKGAFTDAKTDKKGLIESAENGILFLDEIHHLSKAVQARLMKALQTDEYNRLSIRRLGENTETKVKNVRLIFATNKIVIELRNELLPDFYDRIVQHVVNIPPLRETVEDRVSDWENIWKGLKFNGNAPKENELIGWLTRLPLYGNYRDLQKIAMYYNIFNQFDIETKKMINETSPFQYAKNEFEKYHSSEIQTEKEKFNFNINQTTKQMIADYLFELQDWAVKKFKGRKKAIEHFKSRGDTVVEKTFTNWKNKEMLKE
ncbi:MAG: sigma-54 factor interaction domain-containing protein [Arcicella sp.]|jgi:transcriptional regulator with AAA-type ATPase domain|nr:sigma-54 factor interaction domain-containing protein [Microscillaceae bacterium]MCU0469135.1 sigma-54 factor interaction domain-containing protein [Arcicella sp.]